MEKITVEVVRVGERGEPLPLPWYMTSGSAGLDLCADEAFELGPLERRLVPTGLAVDIPSGFEGQVRPRSGLAIKRGITVVNAPGTIDSDYRGEVQVGLINLSKETYRAERGERIAQLVVSPVARADLLEVASLAPSERGGGGFGSTGR